MQATDPGTPTATSPSTATPAAGDPTSGATDPAAPPTATASTAAAGSGATSVSGATGAGSGGPGSLTLAIISPVALSGHVDTPVSCTAGARYVESAAGGLNGHTVAESVRIARYQGPGSYTAPVTVSLADPDGQRYAISAVLATVQVTSSGGGMSFSGTTAGGRTLAGSITWACSG